jgi:surface antigen
MRAIKILAALLVTLVCANGAQSAGVAFMNNTVIGSIPKADWPDFEKAVAQALNDSPDGTASTWHSNTPQRRGGPINVTLTPSDTVQTPKANKCRLLAADVTQGKTAETWKFMFCQNPAGAWRASTN